MVAISSPIGIEALPHDAARRADLRPPRRGPRPRRQLRAPGARSRCTTPDPAEVDERAAPRLRRASRCPPCALAGRDGAGRDAGRCSSASRPTACRCSSIPGRRRRPAAAEASLDRAAVVAGADRLRRPDAGRVADLRHPRPARAARACASCSRCWPAAPRCVSERLATRGGPAVDLRDPLTFYDTSSYGPRLVEAMARWVGPSQLVYGSDRPVIEPVRTGREVELMDNAARVTAATPWRRRYEPDARRARALRRRPGRSPPSAGATWCATPTTCASTSRSGTTRTSTPG